MCTDLPVGDLPVGVLYTQFQDTFFTWHLIGTSMDQQHIRLILLKVEQSAFTQASLSSLLDVHKYLGGLQMALSSLEKQTANCDSPHEWLINLTINGWHLAVFSETVAFACHFVATAHPTPSYTRSASDIGSTSINLSKQFS